MNDAIKTTVHPANAHIQEFDSRSDAYVRLRVAADLLNLFSVLSASVQTTYFDMGQNWKWTTIIARKPNAKDGVQILSAAQQREIVFGSMADMYHVVRDLILKYGPRTV